MTHWRSWEAEQEMAAVEAFERWQVKQRRMPNPRNVLLRRLGFLFQILGALLLGLNIAVVAVLLNFFLFIKVLHVSF